MLEAKTPLSRYTEEPPPLVLLFIEPVAEEYNPSWSDPGDRCINMV